MTQREKSRERLPWIFASVGWALAAYQWIWNGNEQNVVAPRLLRETADDFKDVFSSEAQSSLLDPGQSKQPLWRTLARDFYSHFDLEKAGEEKVNIKTSITHANHQQEDQSEDNVLPEDALSFLLAAIFIGVLITYLTTLKPFKSVQQSVALFVVGVVFSLLLQGLGLHQLLGVFGTSYEMWMGIDPHLLLYTMLPALLTADAMTIDTSVAERVVGPVLYLAGPGVVINAILTALFFWFYLPYEWNFLLCLTVGSILSATDPVAVVALLKELGASPVLTVAIQGESLLNDGSSIVLFTVGYEMLRGVKFTSWDVSIFLIETAGCAWVVGMCIGWLYVALLKITANRFEHSSSIMQVVLTLCCAYSSFVLADNFLHVSGALSCVSASLVLADKMWTAIVEKETLLSFWHIFEYMGNCLIFFLAGALTGKSMVHVSAKDYLHLFVIYVVLVVIRGGLVFGSRPLLTWLSRDKNPVTLADATVMTWGGLRGAVGLALAIQVATERAGGRISMSDAHRVLFYVGGIAAMTLVLNATTSPYLVEWLGITQMPETSQEVLLMFHSTLRAKAQERKYHPWSKSAVVRLIDNVLEDAEAHIQNEFKSSTASEDSMANNTLLTTATTFSRMTTRHKFETSDLSVELKNARASVTAISFLNQANSEFTSIFESIPDMPFHGELDPILATAKLPYDNELLRTFHDTFLQVVSEHYRSVPDVLLHSRAKQEQMLMLSVALAKSDTYNLTDYEHLLRLLEDDANEEQKLQEEVQMQATYSRLRRCTESLPFTFVMMLVIVGSAIASQVNEHHEIWLPLEISFNAVFTLELILKLFAQGCEYFKSSWNIFDVVMVFVGLMGLSPYVRHEIGTEADLLRVVRLFRMVRLMRIFRLVRFIKSLRMYLSLRDPCFGIETHMRKLSVLKSFAFAHLAAQEEFGRCFTITESPELARCIVQSQTFVWKAIAESFRAEQCLIARDKEAFCAVCAMRDAVQALTELENFVGQARKTGVLDDREAESVQHAIHEHHESLYRQLNLALQGITELPEDSSIHLREILVSLTSRKKQGKFVGGVKKVIARLRARNSHRDLTASLDFFARPDGRSDGVDHAGDEDEASETAHLLGTGVQSAA